MLSVDVCPYVLYTKHGSSVFFIFYDGRTCAKILHVCPGKKIICTRSSKMSSPTVNLVVPGYRTSAVAISTPDQSVTDNFLYHGSAQPLFHSFLLQKKQKGYLIMHTWDWEVKCRDRPTISIRPSNWGAVPLFSNFDILCCTTDNVKIFKKGV